MNFKRVLICLALATAVVLSAILLPKNTTSESYDIVMDTNASVSVKSRRSSEVAGNILISAGKLEKQISKTMSGGDLKTVNAEGSGPMDGAGYGVIIDSLELCRMTGGALDIALGSLTDYWNTLKKNPAEPDDDIIDELKGSKYECVTVKDGIVSLEGGALLDLGAVGKGAACDEAYRILNDAKASRAVVSFGGSILFYGKGSFTVGISSPVKGSSDYIATVKTTQGFVSTSGTYERYFDLNGVRYHHILDPVTGYPVQNGLVSVTVFADSGIESDALSTACFVMGLEKGMNFAVSNGYEAVFVDDNNNIYVTEGLRDSVKVTDSSYSIVK